MRAVIRAVDFAVPCRRVANEEFSATLDTSDEWIRSHTGIRFRHIADPSMATSDLAFDACKKALEKANVSPQELDLLLVATVTGDYIGFPSVSCIVQGKLGASHAGAMDLVAGCTGFIYGLETARGFVLSGFAKNVLVAGADTLSRIINWQDRNTCVLFGDGAGAALVTGEEGDGDRGIIRSFLRADGTGANLLERSVGGTRFPFGNGSDPLGTYLKMDGRQVYNFAVKVVSEGIVEML
ncbi:MAG TPA: beta-ketoacyl-ACP synthase 3, partial [Spirochaetia bacterium]|nr:beta-ketoacyl-ACP synthase 3 [Spirochaetia bacterium]